MHMYRCSDTFTYLTTFMGMAFTGWSGTYMAGLGFIQKMLIYRIGKVVIE